jgi:hypothetical protein
MGERPFVPDWFWEIVDSTRPDLLALAEQLEKLDREQLLSYYHFYEVASDAVCHQWEGPYIDDEIRHLSEDGTQDLTYWIVSNGKDFWLRATEPDADLVELFWMSVEVDRGEIPDPPKWTSDVANDNRRGSQTPNYIAGAIYRERFDGEFLDALEELRQKM